MPAAVALSACGLVPRPDYAEGATIDRVYPVEMNRLASCAYDRLDPKWQRVQKADFPDRHAARIYRDTEAMRLWQIDMVAAGPSSTKVSIPIPRIVGSTQPEALFAEIDTCAH